MLNTAASPFYFRLCSGLFPSIFPNERLEVKMSDRNLTQLDDLEKSIEWASLANEINDLEKMCHLNNHRHSRKPVPKYQNYERHSMPQMQKATSVWIDDFESRRQTTPDHWNWKPKTEFERSYFFEDYQDQFENNSQKPYSYSEDYEKDHGKSMNEEKLSNSNYKGTRERLHEIFERNRYLRRQFFSNYVTDIPKDFENRRKYNNMGFGSTETLTSQSNQSSISSIDRKPRSRVNITPELETGTSPRGYAKNTSSNFRDVQKDCLSPRDVPRSDLQHQEIEELNPEDAKEKEVTENRITGQSPNRIYSGDRCQKVSRNFENTENVSPNTSLDNGDDGMTKKLGEDSENKELKPKIRDFDFKSPARARIAREKSNEIGASSLKEERSSYCQQNLCKSLPNLSASLSQSDFIEDSASPVKRGADSGGKFERSYDRFASQADLPSLSHGMSLRRVRITKIPAPLDLSKVNERYEQLQALENVDVSLIRDYDRPLNGLATVIKDESDDDFREGSLTYRGENRVDRRAAEELQSPQLVYNSKSSVHDRRTNTNARRPRPAEFTRALSDQDEDNVWGSRGAATP
nr:uncharacterized protein LOC116435069 [Nomia melanderi]